MTPPKKSLTLHTSAITDSGSGTAVSQEPLRPADQQLKTWDAAVRLFSRRKYEDALHLFREAARGPAAHVADKARSYGQICERKMSGPEMEFRNAEDHFYFGVERMNARDLDQAHYHLSRALRLQPEGDNILYALALCRGFAGDIAGAYENLKRAIDLDPRNRIMARQDSDFRNLAGKSSALRALLGADGSPEA